MEVFAGGNEFRPNQLIIQLNNEAGVAHHLISYDHSDNTIELLGALGYMDFHSITPTGRYILANAPFPDQSPQSLPDARPLRSGRTDKRPFLPLHRFHSGTSRPPKPGSMVAPCPPIPSPSRRPRPQLHPVHPPTRSCLPHATLASYKTKLIESTRVKYLGETISLASMNHQHQMSRETCIRSCALFHAGIVITGIGRRVRGSCGLRPGV